MYAVRDLFLIVEDNLLDQKLIQRAMKKAGLTNPPQIVSDGDAAVAYLAGLPPFEDRTLHPFPSVVLLDLKMPRRDGFEVLAWVRAQPALRRLPIVVLTSSHDAADVNRAYDLGANSYLVKPVALGDLADLLLIVDRYWVKINTKPDLKPTP